MSLATIFSRACVGIQAPQVTVETHVSNGLPKFSIVGLPETVVKESRDRVRSAIINSQFEFPARRITVNLAPADLPKEGGCFDLPIALSILAATSQIPTEHLSRYEFAGELALSGELRPIHGAFPFALATRTLARELILPSHNAKEAAMIENVVILPAEHLLNVCSHLQGQSLLTAYQPSDRSMANIPIHDLDMSDIKGQTHAKRALEIASAGGHNILLIGPPGTGKTMLASRLANILPPLTEDEACEIAAIISISRHKMNPEHWYQRPFRSPHHTASSAALVGGGNPPCPGEISLAHQGVLFLDELPEFNRKALETLREPLESGRIIISRAAHQAEYPAQFQLIAAMNPCPCGQAGNPNQHCHCTTEQVQRYRNRLSGPLLDRIDLQIEVPFVPLHTVPTGEKSADIRNRVIQARKIQLQRANKINHLLNNQELQNTAKYLQAIKHY